MIIIFILTDTFARQMVCFRQFMATAAIWSKSAGMCCFSTKYIFYCNVLSQSIELDSALSILQGHSNALENEMNSSHAEQFIFEESYLSDCLPVSPTLSIHM